MRLNTLEAIAAGLVTGYILHRRRLEDHDVERPTLFLVVRNLDMPPYESPACPVTGELTQPFLPKMDLGKPADAMSV